MRIMRGTESATRGGAASRGRRGALLLAALVAAAACGIKRADREATEGPVSEIEATRRIREAIRRSSEGVILMPSRKAERMFELPRLNELAQDLRQPFAACFLRRAILTMQPRPGQRGFAGVPEGQAKIRTRIAPSGEVVRAEVLESGFDDDEMEACLVSVIEDVRWPENKSGNVHFVDVVYWVSLGAQRDRDTPVFAQHLRREALAAGVRGKPCLQGRVDAGSYRVDGLNLVDREGGTLVNRVEQSALPEPIRACIARAFRDIRLARDPDAFVRPIAPTVEYRIERDGSIAVVGEDWLRLVELEEAAAVAQKRAAMTGELEGDDPGDPTSDPGPEPVDAQAPPLEPPGGEAPAHTSDPDETEAPAEPPAPTPPPADPGKGGLRLDLGGRAGE